MTNQKTHATLTVVVCMSVDEGKPFERMGHKAIGPSPEKIGKGSQLPKQIGRVETDITYSLCAFKDRE